MNWKTLGIDDEGYETMQELLEDPTFSGSTITFEQQTALLFLRISNERGERES